MVQYLMLVDEVGMSLMRNVLNGINFLPVEGFEVEGMPNHYGLVTPKPQPQEVKAEDGSVGGG